MSKRMWPAIVFALSCVSAPCLAQAPPDSPAEPRPESSWDSGPAADSKAAAQKLFDSGLQDMLTGKYDQGCPVLAESYKLDPLPGALFTLAECEAGWGRSTSALVHYRQYLSQFERMSDGRKAGQGERAEVARNKVTILYGLVPRLKIISPADFPETAVVTRDGTVVPASLLDVAVPVDPGQHEVVVRASGYLEARWTVNLAEAEQRELLLSLEPKSEGTSHGATLRTAGYVSGGIGIAALLMGGIGGMVTLGHRSTINDNCIELLCNQEGLDAADAASTSGTVADFGFGLGIVGVSAAIVLLILAPDDVEAPSADVRTPYDKPAVKVKPLVNVGAASPSGSGRREDQFLLGVQGSW